MPHDGHVHYLDFIIHGTTHSLTQYSFKPTSEAGDGLVAAVQVDGDPTPTPTSFTWTTRTSAGSNTHPGRPPPSTALAGRH